MLLIWVVQMYREKYFYFGKSESVISSRCPASARGAYASSRTWGGMRWTRMRRKTSGANADGEVVWSWRPDAGAKFLRSKLLRDDGGKRARSPGRSRISRKTIAQGGPDDPPVPVVLPRAFCCTRTMGAVGTRPSLRPLFFGGDRSDKLGRVCVPRALRRVRSVLAEWCAKPLLAQVVARMVGRAGITGCGAAPRIRPYAGRP